MASRHRKLWKVTSGWNPNITDPTGGGRPESQRKAFDVYVANDRASGRYDWSKVWFDGRDGRGWQLFEIIEHERKEVGGP